MDVGEAALWAIVVFIIIAGLWLSGLTYLMWRAHQRRMKELEAGKPAAEAPPPEKDKPA